ncbi:MAG: hypothetical protein U5K00_19920 [Melioribacteraceae bacterium]|nr:hypothetical protein [Melioribacteraceae bacterium]
MKKYLLVFAVLLFSVKSFAQIDLMGGMGISFQSTPSLTDYINNLVADGEKLNDFSSSINFFIEGDYEISSTFDLGIEYENKLFSYNTAFGGLGTYDLTWTTHSPSLLAYYAIQGTGYKFKFGGGAGYRLISVDEELPTSNQIENYTSSGFGLLLKAQAHTLLGGNFHAYIGTDIRYDFIGEPSNEKSKIGTADYGREIDFNTLGVGVKLGISYLIR